jgi:hypothetical protein
MSERAQFKLGGGSAVIGAVLALILNGLHPHVDTAEAVLRAAAGNDNWLSLHLGLILGVLLILGGLVVVTRTFGDGAGALLAQLGLVTAVLGVGLFLTNFALDGMATQNVARAWLNAPAADRALAFRIAETFDQITFALYTLWVIVFTGLAFVVYGLAILTDTVYPKWFGWVAVLAGSGSVVVGLAQAYAGRSAAIEIGFVVCSVTVTLWMLAIGIVLWRRADGTVNTAVSSGASPALARRLEQ